MIKLIINCLRWRRFIKKVHKDLPDYHPETGQRLYWEIYILTFPVLFNTKTGEPLKFSRLPKLAIRQKLYYRVPTGSPVYKFDWKKKEIIDTGKVWWG